MAFSTQRKFIGQCYEHNELAEINKMKCYNSIKDHRAWSMDQQACYLVDAVHKGEGDTVNSENTVSNESTNEIKKTSKRVGGRQIVSGNADTSSRMKRTDTLKMFELTMELEAIKLTNRTLENDNEELRTRIMLLEQEEEEQEDEDIENHFQIIEDIFLERNDLRILLDKFLGVTDQILELKIQADQMKDIESEYVSLQLKFREHQLELEALRSQKITFEEKILELQTNNPETSALKEANLKLETDLRELSNMISVSNNFIQEQDSNIKSKLSTISQLRNQIENLKVSLSEAELKLNKKLRLEMDVELMEKELSIMIEHSAESVNSYSQQVIDRQVEDLATAIKLTLGYMNYELENDEDDNLVEANRQLKTLLLESSNKILEFKDVINKQESNLMRVTNDFACKNEELTECLGTVEELKRQLANRRNPKSYLNCNVDPSNIQNVAIPGEHNLNDDFREDREMFEHEINLGDSPQNSEYESDGQEIEVLENIFERSCRQEEFQDDPNASSKLSSESKDKTQRLVDVHRKLKKRLRNIREELTQVKDDFKQRREEILNNIVSSLPTLKGMSTEEIKTNSPMDQHEKANVPSKDDFNKLSEKLEEMGRCVMELEIKNDELKLQNRNLLAQTEETVPIDNINPKLKELETQLSELRKENEYLRQANPTYPSRNECSAANNTQNSAPEETSAMDKKYKEKETETVKDYNDIFTNTESAAPPLIFEQQHESMTAAMKKLQYENEKLKSTNESLTAEIKELRIAENLENKSYVQKSSSPAAVLNSNGNMTEEIENINENLKLANKNLVAEIDRLKNSENCAHKNILELEKDLQRLSCTNENLLTQLHDLNVEKTYVSKAQEPEKLPTEVKELITKNEELKNINEKLLAEIADLERDKTLASNLNRKNEELKNTNEKLLAKISDLERVQDNTRESDSEILFVNNENLIRENESKLQSTLHNNMEYRMASDIRDLQIENEKLKIENKNIMYELTNLRKEEENTDRSPHHAKFKDCCEKSTLTTERPFLKEKYREELQNDEHKKLVADTKNVIPKVELITSNENLMTEIGELKHSENSSKTMSQMEKDLEKLTAINERLLTQPNYNNNETHQLATPDIINILKQNKELKILNETLANEIKELKNAENLADSNIVEMKNELRSLANTKNILLGERNELKQLSSNNEKLESDWMAADMKKLQTKNEKLKAANEKLLSEIEKLKAKTPIQELEDMPPDMKNLLNKNQDLKNVNENLSAKIRELQSTENRAHLDIIELKNELEKLQSTNGNLQGQINKMKLVHHESKVDTDLKKWKTENEKLKLANDNLLTQISNLREELENIENRKPETTQELKKPSTARDTLIMKEKSLKTLSTNDYNMETDWMVADMKKLQSKNEKLKAANEKLLAQISDLQCHSQLSGVNLKNISENMLLMNENIPQGSDCELQFTSNQSIESDWMKAEIEKLQSKTDKLKIANESLIAEIGVLKGGESRAHKNILQMERDLVRLSLMNEKLSSQLNDKKTEKKQFPKVQEVDGNASDVKNLLKTIDELKNTNENLSAENDELKSLEAVKMKNDLKRLSSANESLKLQISELKLLSSNDLKMESHWMASDMKKILNKNKKLNVANQNLLAEINDLRRELQSIENCANTIQNEKELEKLYSINESLMAQINNQKLDKAGSSKHQEFGLDALPDVKKVHKKNEDLKAANEKLSAVIINLKNSEMLANSKSFELEKELKQLKETNKYLQETLENCVEKDLSSKKPKTELERLCQLIVNEGIASLTEAEFSFMCKWFNKSASIDHEIPKSGRMKNGTKKHCRICHQSVDSWNKICECKQFEEKKRLHLLKEIEETKLAIKHIQSSNDIEFDMNDVKNRLLKVKQSDMERIYEIEMGDEQRSLNVRTHINKPISNRNQMS